MLKEFSYGAQTSIIIVSNFQNFRPNISMVYWAFKQNQTDSSSFFSDWIQIFERKCSHFVKHCEDFRFWRAQHLDTVTLNVRYVIKEIANERKHFFNKPPNLRSIIKRNASNKI